MADWDVDVLPSGAVRLGPDVVCDGFLHEARARIQTHIHADHLIDFDTSKGYQEIVASHVSRELLVAIRNADLLYRENLRGVDWGAEHVFGGSAVCLRPSGHILGSAQAEVRLPNGLVVAYSGDFQWPLQDVVACDVLVLDSTHGNPRYQRQYGQLQVEEELVELLARVTRRGLVLLRGHTGALQRITTRIAGEMSVPLVASRATIAESVVYARHGYVTGELIDQHSERGAEIMRSGRGIVLLRMNEKPPALSTTPIKVMLSGYISDPKEPILEFNDSDYRVALSDHADFNGIVEYVRATRAKRVLTDNTRGGHAVELARELSRLLGIDANPSSDSSVRYWGSGKV